MSRVAVHFPGVNRIVHFRTSARCRLRNLMTQELEPTGRNPWQAEEFRGAAVTLPGQVSGVAISLSAQKQTNPADRWHRHSPAREPRAFSGELQAGPDGKHVLQAAQGRPICSREAVHNPPSGRDVAMMPGSVIVEREIPHESAVPSGVAMPPAGRLVHGVSFSHSRIYGPRCRETVFRAFCRKNWPGRT